MSVANVLRLDEYRDRRTYRLRLAEALRRADPHKRSILAHLVEIADLSGADRVATVWLEEYGSGAIHPHVVLDQSSDRPRRAFSPEPLREAWELGVPSAHDRPLDAGSRLPATLAISLGSDGARAWFLVAESTFARPALGEGVRDRIMFLAGECAAIVLHTDLDLVARDGAIPRASFAGWRILEDLDGREPDEAESRRIAQRFIVGRLARMLVDEELVVSSDRAADQVRRARAELGGLPVDDREAMGWSRVLDALEGGRYEDVAAELVEVGDAVEAMGHTNGALELYGCAYDIAAALGEPRPAVDAARLTGRVLRRRAEWEEARAWFEIAHEIAGVSGMRDVAARALVGLAGIKKEVGNLPAAREGLTHALALAEASEDRDTIALVHHAFLGVEQVSGNMAEALTHAWIAAATYESEEGRLRCVASLAGALSDFGDREAAEDAWSIVAHASTDAYYLAYAHEGLANIAAERGDEAAFECHSARNEELGWGSMPHAARADILYTRGLSYRALGRRELAREWLERAVTFAEEHKFGRILFLAEEALRSTPSLEAASDVHTPTAPREVREGLRAMRRELAVSTA